MGAIDFPARRRDALILGGGDKILTVAAAAKRICVNG